MQYDFTCPQCGHALTPRTFGVQAEIDRLQAESRNLRLALALPQPIGDARHIPLSQGAVSVVDAADFPELARWAWFLKISDGDLRYAYRMGERGDRRITVPMHQQLVGIGDGRQVDHINHDGLDNRRANLRLATSGQNSRNIRVGRSNNKSGFKGVSWSKNANKWHAQIAFEGRNYHLGYFSSPEVAAAAYNAKAIELQGDFALLNDLPAGAEP